MLWKSMDKNEKENYFSLAREVDAEHKRKYPGKKKKKKTIPSLHFSLNFYFLFPWNLNNFTYNNEIHIFQIK